MAKIILVHGSGHRAASWEKTVSCLGGREDVLCPELSDILGGKEASYPNLCASFADYCAQVGEPFHLCGLSLGGILALHYTLEHPEQVRTLVLIGTPHKVPGESFALQNAVFRFLPKSVFTSMAFDKRNTFALGSSMKNLDFSARAGGIRCPALILCGGKGSGESPIRPVPGSEHPGRGAADHRAYRPCGQ